MRDKIRELAEKLLYETRAGRTLLLLGAGTFALPEQVENDPRIARFANYAIPPLLAAGLFGPAFATFGDAMLSVASVGRELSHEDYRRLLNNIFKFNGAAGFAISLAAIYLIASIRWTDHRLWVRIFQGFGLPARPTTLRFFLLTTSYITAISAGFLAVIALLIPVAVERNGEAITEFLKAHPALVLGVGGLFALVSTIRERIDRLRDRQMYGPPWARTVKGVVTTAVFMGVALLLPRLVL